MALTKVSPSMQSRDFESVTSLLADTVLAYAGTGTEKAVVGDTVVTRSEGFSYEVAAAGAADVYLTTAGGVKLYVLPGANGAVTASQCWLTGTGDETVEVLKWVQWATDNGYPFDFEGGSFTVSQLNFTGDTSIFNGTLVSNKALPDGPGFQDDVAFEFSGEFIGDVAVTADFAMGEKTLTLADTSTILKGDILRLQSSRLIDTDHRGAWREGQMVRVSEVLSATEVALERPIVYYGKASDIVTGTISSFSADRYTVTVSTSRPGNGRDRSVEITITSGAGAGESRFILATSGTGDINLRHSGSLAGEWDRDPWPVSILAGDTYSYAWTSTVEVIRPAKVTVKDMLFTRTMKQDFLAGEVGFRGVRLQNTSMSLVRDCRIENFNMTALHLSKSYIPTVEDLDVFGANLSHGVSSGTGYGVSVETCSNPRIRNVTGSNCRRVVDLSGAGGYTDHGECVNIVAIGGGLTYTGGVYYPDGAERQSAVGSHGSGRFSRYIDCMGINTYGGMNLRGREEFVSNYIQLGACDQPVNINFSSGHVIDGLTYTDQFSEELRDLDFRHVNTAVDTGKRPSQMVYLDFADPFADNVVTIVRNVRAKSIIGAAVTINGTGALVQNLVFENWNISVTDEGTLATDFRFFNTSGSATFDKIVLRDIDIYRASGEAFSGTVDLISVPRDIAIADGGKIRINNVWYAQLVDGGIARFPFSAEVAVVNMVNVRTGARPRTQGVILQTGSATTLNLTADKTLVDVLATYPTGIAGVTAGNFGINLDITNGFVSVVNNVGTTQTFKLSVE